MKVGDLIDLLMSYQNDDEIEIEIYETTSGHYIDTTASISIVENDAFVPTLKIEARQKILCKRRQAVVKKRGATQRIFRTGHRPA